MFLNGFQNLAVVEELREFIHGEFDHQRTRFRKQIGMPLDERIEKFICLAGLEFKEIDQHGRAGFRHPGNDSRLREGDHVRLSRNGAPDEWQKASIYREEDGEIWLASESPFSVSHFERMGFDGWILDEDFLDLEGFYLDALSRVETTAIGQERILPLLAGDAETSLDDETYGGIFTDLDEAAIPWEDAQKQAIAGCLAADHCYLVQGPPGTGKTRALAETVRQLVERGERVLITAFTHRAIDNALSATARVIGDRSRVARFAPPMHRRDENYDSYETFADSPLMETKGGWVAGATPFALRKRLSGVEFDAIVIDEAGQMTTPLAIMAMLAGPKYLLFGDQEQLGPVIVSRPSRETENLGIFYALRQQTPDGTRLDVSYRLNEELVRWPSENFYGGELSSAESARGRRLAWSRPPDVPDAIAEALAPGSSLVWIPCDHSVSRTSSESEIEIALELLKALEKGGVPFSSVAVVTPYRRQGLTIRRRLQAFDRSGTSRDCVIDTVERMQGQEREVIILSMCASDSDFVRRQADFLFDPRRLNVSATRARTKLVILASEDLLYVDLNETDQNEDRDLFASLCRSAVRIDPSF